ncbi:MAG: S9 family peptidase [Gammaproteobacteria bacterium]|nr:S9 family peptidase [Gammaproteobacteria bacterium]
MSAFHFRKPSYLNVLLLSALSITSTIAQSDTSKYLQSEDIFNLEIAATPKVSADGKKVAYVRRTSDIMTDTNRSNIWIVDVDGNNHRPLFSGKNSFHSPVWSPSGDRLAYISNEDGQSQLYVRWMDTGQTALLSNVQESIGNVTWSPDGEQIAFTMKVKDSHKPLDVKMPKKPKGAKWSESVEYVTKARYQADGAGILEPAYTHIFVIPALGGTARQLTSGNYNHGGALAWGKTGRKIFFSANRHDEWEYQTRESNIFSVTLDGDIQQITDEPGAEYNPKVSPDGKYIAYLSADDKKLAYRNRYLMIKNIAGADWQTNLSKNIDNALSNIHWNKNGSGLYYQMEERGTVTIGYTDLKSQHKKLVQGLGGGTMGRPYTFATFDVNNDVVAYTKGKTDRPADVYTNVRGTNTQVTYLNEDVLGHKVLGEVSEVIYNSSIDGEEIQGWYITPPDFDPSKKYPLILEIHGGPHLSYGPHFTAELQRFAAEGYVVFYDNHRGSTGYGERFALLLQNKYSSKYDFADHMSGVDAMIDKGFIDKEKLYIAGGSAGGIASAYAIGLTDRFKAAAVSKPVINWISKVLTADSYLGQIPNQFPGMPWDNFEHYWQRSPLSLVGNVTTPTMLLTGEADRRTPMSETEQFYQALKLRKVDTIMVRVPGSPHGIAGKPSRMVAKIENILAWFAKYQ